MTDMNSHSFTAMKNSAFEEGGNRKSPERPSVSLHLFAATIILGLCSSMSYAGDVSFSPQGQPPYLWSIPANWSGGALPGPSDNAIFADAALGTYPIVVDGSATRTVNELHLKPASGATTLMEVASGATLTVTKLFMGNQGSGASFNGALVRIDNYGTINVANFRMGRGNSTWATAGTPTIFHNHAGATFSNTGTGTWNFYVNQDGGNSLFINEGAMSNTSGSPLWLGMGQGHSELRMQGDGVFTANGAICMGYSYPSTSHVVLADRGRITGSGEINVGHGNGHKATGYLVLSNNATIAKSSGRVNIGTYTAGSAGHLEINDSASVTLNDYLSVGNSTSTRGTVEMAGNSALSGVNAVVANANNSTGTISMAGSSRLCLSSTLYMGGSYSTGDNSFATVALTDSAEADIANQIFIGMRTGSGGTLSLNGRSRLSVTNNLFIGYNAGSAGIVSVAGNATLAAPNIRVGQSTSSGLLTLSDNATLFATNIEIVSWGTATGRFMVGGDAIVTNLLAMTIGHPTTKCDATLAMRGGAVFFDIDTENPRYVQNGYLNPIHLNPWRTEVCGRIVGWGKVALSDPVTFIANADKPCGLSHYGQVVADGEGMPRDLDFSRAAALNFYTTDANPSGTNGWFAVNKGRLRLPRSLPRKTNNAFCVGDCWTLNYAAVASAAVTSNRLANTFSATFTGAGTGNYIFADLYATDRDDIPAGIDDIHPDQVISVWRIGLFNDGPENDEPSTPSSFTSADLRFRIPGDVAAGIGKLYILRHDGTANGKWKIVGRAKNPDVKWPVIQAKVAEPSSANWNVGWFAVIEHEAPFGTILVVRSLESTQWQDICLHPAGLDSLR